MLNTLTLKSKRILTTTVLSVVASLACAQTSLEPANNTEELLLGTSSPDILLQRGDVRDDLQLSMDQSIKLFDLQDKVQSEEEQLATPAAEGDDSPQVSYEAIRKYATEQIDLLLTPDQNKRLKQIALQITGYSALARTELQKQVGMPKDLAIKIYDLTNEERQANQSVIEKFGAGHLTPDQYPEIIKKNHATLNKEIGKLLPQSLKDRFNALCGRIFKAY